MPNMALATFADTTTAITLMYTSTKTTLNISSNTTDASNTISGNFVIALIVEVLILGLVSGNLLIVTTIALYKPWTIADTLLFSLSVADLINGAIPLQLLNIINNFLRPDMWNFGLCTMYLIVTYTLRMASVCTITFIAIERALMLTKPLRHLTSVTVSRVKKLIMSVWAFSVFLAVLPFVGVGKHGYHNGFCRYQLFDLGTAYGYLIETVGIVQLLIVLACFVLIKFTTGRFIKRQNLMSAASQIGSCADRKKTQDSSGAKQVKQLATLMGVVVVLYYISWLPYLMVNLVSLVKKKPESSSEVVIAGLFSLINGLINPILYGKMSTRYRKGYVFVLRKITSLCGCAPPEADFFKTNRKGSAVYNTSMASLGSLKRDIKYRGVNRTFTNDACSVNDTDEMRTQPNPMHASKKTMHVSASSTHIPGLSTHAPIIPADVSNTTTVVTINSTQVSANSNHVSVSPTNFSDTAHVISASTHVSAKPTHALRDSTHALGASTHALEASTHESTKPIHSSANPSYVSSHPTHTPNECAEDQLGTNHNENNAAKQNAWIRGTNFQEQYFRQETAEESMREGSEDGKDTKGSVRFSVFDTQRARARGVNGKTYHGTSTEKVDNKTEVFDTWL